MTNQIRDYLHLLQVGSSSPDPTIPFDNDFYLLGLNEGDSDKAIAKDAKNAGDTRSSIVDKRGQAYQNKRLDILLRDKINQAGIRFDNNPSKVAEHREELYRLRARRLKEFAQKMCDSGKWTEDEGREVIENIASTICVEQDRLQKTVNDATKSAGRWKSSPSSRPPKQVASEESISIGKLTIPFWAIIPLIALALGVIDVWAGFAFGLLFLLLAWGRANTDRKLGAAANAQHMKWGAISAGVAVFPLLVSFAIGQLPVLQNSDELEKRWAGQWETDWGQMTFVVESSEVKAQYTSRTGSGSAELSETESGQLDGTWCRKSCAPPNDTGHLRLLLKEDEQAFSGWYTIGLDSEIEQTDDSAYQVNGIRKTRE